MRINAMPMPETLNAAVSSENAMPNICANKSALWAALFAPGALTVLLLQPPAGLALMMVAMMSVAMAAGAYRSVYELNGWDGAQQRMRLMAPLQLALVVWLAVMIGRDVAGASFIASTLTAFVALGALMVFEGLASMGLLLAAEHGRGKPTPGLSVASMIGAKYAGLFGSAK
jgi:hypothetical protein